jgi:SAM-dependent methyltransferase
MESIPFEDATFDFIWCRDTLVHVQGLRRGFKECGRVLKPGGHMLVFTTYATERMEPKEAADIYGALGIVPENMSPSYVEGCFAEAGFQALTNQTIGSELMQFYEERDGRCTREFMRLARMIQAKERFLAELGEANYRVTSALYHWVIYQLIGKLSSAIYTLVKPAPESAPPPAPAV